MAVTVVVPSALRAEAGGESKLTVAGGVALGRVLDEVGARWPRLERRVRDEQGQLRRYVNVYVDGEECRRVDGLATAVPETAEIMIVPSVAGG